jgi:tripartite-type tricarboxylate transporter receptor subunit TctC
VPFSGDADFMAAVLGGHIEAAMSSPASVAPQSQAGKVRVLATFADKRHMLFPETPTCLELGYDVTVTASHYMMVPKRTPDQMVRTLRDTFKKAMEEQSFKEFIRQSGWVSDYKDPAEMKKELDEYYALFGKTVEKLKLK